MGARQSRQPSKPSNAKAPATTNVVPGSPKVPISPSRRQAYQKVMSGRDSIFRRDSSKDMTKQESETSFRDLQAFRKQGLPLSMSNHSEDITIGSLGKADKQLESSLEEAVDETKSFETASDRQPRTSSASKKQRMKARPVDSRDDDDHKPRQQRRLSLEEQREISEAETAKDKAKAMAQFEKNILHWVAIFHSVSQAEFERAILGELLNLVALVPVCAKYIFWQGFCANVQRKLSLSTGSRVIQVLRRVHPQHPFLPMAKKKKVISGKPNDAGSTGPRSPPRGGAPSGRTGPGGKGGRGHNTQARGGRGRGPGRAGEQKVVRKKRNTATKPRHHDSGLRRPSGEPQPPRRMSDDTSELDYPPSLTSAASHSDRQTSSEKRGYSLTSDPAAGHSSFESLDTGDVDALSAGWDLANDPTAGNTSFESLNEYSGRIIAQYGAFDAGLYLRRSNEITPRGGCDLLLHEVTK